MSAHVVTHMGRKIAPRHWCRTSILQMGRYAVQRTAIVTVRAKPIKSIDYAASRGLANGMTMRSRLRAWEAPYLPSRGCSYRQSDRPRRSDCVYGRASKQQS